MEQLQTPYLLMVGEKGQERLHILNEICNGHTLSFLREADALPQGRCLDIGCGTGLMSCELAKVVGERGSVLGVDISVEQVRLAEQAAGKKNIVNAAFQVLSSNELNQLQGPFDFIYMRFLLCHLRHPEQVIADAVKLLAKGGYILCEDLCGAESFMCYPRSKAYDDYVKTFSLQFEVQGSDPTIGMKLPYMLSKAGLHKRAVQIVQPLLSTPRERHFLSLGLQERIPGLVSTRRMSQSELDAILKSLVELEGDSQSLISFVRYSQSLYRKP